jgi:DNA-directed RNA polymerase specialized sigma subunit
VSKEEKTKDAVVVDEWRLFACATLPKPRPEYDEIVRLYLETHNEKYYDWLLAAYEPKLNTLARLVVEDYDMYGHFADIKMALALGLHKALQSYDPALGVPFMIYKNRFIKSEIHNYIRTMRTGYSVPTAAKYAALRKAMALYNELGKKSDEATIEQIAREIRHSVKYTREIIAAGQRMQSFVDFFVFYTDSDGEEAREDVTTDNSTNPEQVFFAALRSNAVLNAFETLDYRERMMVAAHLGFCPECYEIYEIKEKEGMPVLAPRKKQSLVDLAIEHELADPDTVHGILERAYGKMRKRLGNSGC